MLLPNSPPVARGRPSWYEAAQRERSRPLWRATIAAPANVVATIARALLEIEAGNRPGAQLERVCHPTLWQALDRRLPRDGGPRITCYSLRRVLVQQHRPGLVDGVALLQRGPRLEPVAMRLVVAASGWQLTELQYVPAGGRPDPGQVGR
jgi:Family of unknown function (DUF6459)